MKLTPPNTPCVEDPSGWCQERLFGEPVIEATLRIGVVAESSHVQYQFELRNPESGELLAMRSWPAAPVRAACDDAHYVLDKLLDDVWRLL